MYTYLPNAKASPGSLVASAKSVLGIVRSPIRSVSWETKPSMEPEPYWMLNSEPFALWVEDELESYLVWRKHAMEVHFTLGTQRLLELPNQRQHLTVATSGIMSHPVSRMTLNYMDG